MTTTRCTHCPYMIRLRKDGRIMRHRLWFGDKWQYCDGSGVDPVEFDQRPKADYV